MCGGTLFGLRSTDPRAGLSPRVRGNPERERLHQARARSIPACAGEPCGAPGRRPSPGVYPRVCGGTLFGLRSTDPRAGLSPRVRGNLAAERGGDPRRGSIPACAGEPPPWGRCATSARVYPRVCGGTVLSLGASPKRWGLSPRVRGNRRAAGPGHVRKRSIPACAGEPTDRPPPSTGRRVYPRVCGGTRAGHARAVAQRGLSPRVRGNLERLPEEVQHLGSIPACAGEPKERKVARPRTRVYPRVCGGTGMTPAPTWHEEGLSPRVRGNPLACRPGEAGAWSIPACAGEPASLALSTPQRWVYPRVCGGTAARSTSATSASGLSPRVRGNRCRAYCMSDGRGSIPACAGEPLSAAMWDANKEVYPRVCGGTAGAGAAVRIYQGLSPRVRGNPFHARPYASTVRSIPACAGEPRCY